MSGAALGSLSGRRDGPKRLKGSSAMIFPAASTIRATIPAFSFQFNHIDVAESPWDMARIRVPDMMPPTLFCCRAGLDVLSSAGLLINRQTLSRESGWAAESDSRLLVLRRG